MCHYIGVFYVANFYMCFYFFQYFGNYLFKMPPFDNF